MHEIHKALRSESCSVPCELCSVGSLCIPMLIDNTLNTVLERKQSFAKGDLLAKEGSPFQKFYIIHSGALKTFITVNGIEQINGFYLPGDIVGLDSVTTKRNNNSIKALSNTLVCELKYNELMELVSINSEIRDMVFRLMSQDILNYQKLILSYSQKKADEKLAAFIYALYSRYFDRGHVSLNIKLAMSRSDIGNYLGLTIETVSRILTQLQVLELISVKGKYLCIKSLSGLCKLATENNP